MVRHRSLPPLTSDQKALGFSDVLCIHGSLHRVQAINSLILPLQCSGICLCDTISNDVDEV